MKLVFYLDFEVLVLILLYIGYHSQYVFGCVLIRTFKYSKCSESDKVCVCVSFMANMRTNFAYFFLREFNIRKQMSTWNE